MKSALWSTILASSAAKHMPLVAQCKIRSLGMPSLQMSQGGYFPFTKLAKTGRNRKL